MKGTTLVRSDLLESPEFQGLGARVPRRASRLPRTASRQFQAAWDEMDAARGAKRIDQEKVANENGFERSTWFEYQRKGHIPFNRWEAVCKYLGLKLQVAVIPSMSGVAGTTQARRVDMPEYLQSIVRELEKLPEEQRPVAAGLAVAAIREEVKSRPFEEPVADSKANRARSK